MNAYETPPNRQLLYNFYFLFKYTWIILDELWGPVGSNHGNLPNEIIFLVLGRYGVLRARMNSTEVLVRDRDRTPLSPNHPKERGWTLHRTPMDNTQAQCTGGKEEHVDLGIHVEACQHKSLHAPGSRA